MRTFVPDTFKKKGQSWKRKLSPKEQRQFNKYASAFTIGAYQKRGGK